MQAIRTTYKGPTNTRSAKMRATCAAKAITIPYDHELDEAANHQAAAHALRDSLGWTEANGCGRLIGGDYAGDTYWVFGQT